MTVQFFAAQERGLRGPGLTTEQQTAIDDAIDTAATAGETANNALFGAGDVTSQVTDGGSQVSSGAVLTEPLYITVPAGQVGNISYIRLNWPFAGAAYAGKTMRFKVKLKTSVPFTRSLLNYFSVATAGAPNVDRPAATKVVTEGSEIVISFDYVVQGDETAIRPFLRIDPVMTAPTVVAEFYRVTGFTALVVDTPTGLLTAGDENAKLLRDAILSQTVLRPAYAETIKVKPAGGDFTNIAAAVAAISGSSSGKQYKIAWWAGATLGTPDFHVPAWTSIICQDPRDDAVLSFANPDNASAAVITDTSLAWLAADGIVIEGGTWTIENGRYVFHWESNGGSPNSQQRLVNVVAKHLGNADAVNNTWVPFSQYACGCGVSAGQVQIVEDCDLSGPGGGFSSHSPNGGLPWDTPFRIDLSGSRFEATNPAYKDLLLKPIARGPGEARIRGCSFDELGYYAGEWIGGDPGAGVNCAQIAVAGSGNSNLARTGKPAFVNGITFGNAAGKAYAGMFTGA